MPRMETVNYRQLWFNYITTTQNSYPLEIGFKPLQINDIYFEPELTRKMCEQGCKNYNYSGGCPPYAPFFNELVAGNAKTLFLLYGTFWPQYKTMKVKNSSSIYVHYRLQDQIVSKVLHKIGFHIKQIFGCYFVGAGYCMGCAGKKCNFKKGGSFCLNPDKRTYSMEATGINVAKTLLHNFRIKLYWYKKNGDLNIPLTKCCAFIFYDEVKERDLYHQINKFLEKTA